MVTIKKKPQKKVPKSNQIIVKETMRLALEDSASGANPLIDTF